MKKLVLLLLLCGPAAFGAGRHIVVEGVVVRDGLAAPGKGLEACELVRRMDLTITRGPGQLRQAAEKFVDRRFVRKGKANVIDVTSVKRLPGREVRFYEATAYWCPMEVVQRLTEDAGGGD